MPKSQRSLGDTADEEQAMQELKALLLPRIAEGLRGQVSCKSITDIAEEVLESGNDV